MSNNKLVGEKGTGKFKAIITHTIHLKWTRAIVKGRRPTRGKEIMEPDFSGVIALADGMKNNGAILSVNLLKNGIAVKQAHNLAGILIEHPTLKSLCGNSGDETELDMSDKDIGAAGAVMLAAEILGNRALSSLNLADNCLSRAAGWEPHAYHVGWFSGPNGEFEQQAPQDMSGTITLAGAIRDMGALSTFTFGGDYSSEPVTMETTMTKADFSGKKLGVSGGMMVAAFLPKCQ
jgi:hypothetical protein